MSLNVEWYTVKQHVDKQLTAAQQALETCEHDKIEYFRGRIHALRSILTLAEQPELDGVTTIPSSF